MKTRVLLAAMVSGMLAAVPAEAKKYVYSPIVHEGEKELEYYADWREDPGGTTVVGHELEFAYVYAPRDKISFYGVWEEQSKGGDPEFVAYKIEWIHQLFEQGRRNWDAGIYLEYKIQADTPVGGPGPGGSGEPDKVEFKPLLQRGFGRTLLTLNGVLEKEIGARAQGGTELGYAAQLLWRVSPVVTPGVEVFGGFGELGDFQYQASSHIAGPVANIRLGRRVAWQVGALWGFTNGAEDLRVKSNLAFEWY